MEAQQTRMALETQKEGVKRHLKHHRSITPQVALRKFGTMRLGSIIHRLRGEGWLITTIREGAQGYARYVMIASEGSAT